MEAVSVYQKTVVVASYRTLLNGLVAKIPGPACRYWISDFYLAIRTFPQSTDSTVFTFILYNSSHRISSHFDNWIAFPISYNEEFLKPLKRKGVMGTGKTCARHNQHGAWNNRFFQLPPIPSVADTNTIAATCTSVSPTMSPLSLRICFASTLELQVKILWNRRSQYHLQQSDDTSVPTGRLSVYQRYLHKGQQLFVLAM